MTVVGDEALIGHMLDGRYVIHERIARGGMASVFRATDLRLDRTVAVKIMHGGLGDPAVFTDRFEHEARASAKLNHRNVVAVFDQGTDGDFTYLVMEYVPGRTLRDLMREEAPMVPARALTYLEPVLLALAAAHEARLVHRDIKPENVLISQNGEVKVADFGLARAVSNSTTHSGGALIGTVSYLAPEVVTNRGADPRADVYACGAVLYEMLTGRKAHVADTPLQVAYMHVNEDVGKPSAIIPGIPDYVDALVARATARDRGQRSPDARAFLQQVRQVRRALASGLGSDPELTTDLQPGTGPTPAQLPTMPTQVELNTPTNAPIGGSAADSIPTATVLHPDPNVVWRTEPTRPTPVPSFKERLIQQGRPAPVAPVRVPPRVPQSKTAPVEPRRATKRGLLALLAAFVALALVTLLGWYIGEGRYVQAPQLVGMSSAEAIEMAEADGFQISSTEEEFSEDVPADTIISTDPEALSKVLPESSISLVISKGPERYPVPDVAGTTVDGAQSALSAVHLELGEVTEQYHDSVEAGQVISIQGHTVGEEVRRDTAIDLVVSMGREPIEITNQIGVSEASAAQALADLGFLTNIVRVNSDTVPTGVVASQSPESGEAYRGDTITLSISQGPEVIEVPRIIDMSADDARAAIEAAGLEFRSSPAPWTDDPIVFLQTPLAGAEAQRGDRVTAYVR